MDEQPAARAASGCDHPDHPHLRGLSKVFTLPWPATASGRGSAPVTAACGQGSEGSAGSEAWDTSWPEVIDCAQPEVIDCSQPETEAQMAIQQPCPLRRLYGGLLQAARDHEAARDHDGFVWGRRSTPRHASVSPASPVESRSALWESEEHGSRSGGHVFCGALASALVPSETSPRLQGSGPAILWARRTVRFSSCPPAPREPPHVTAAATLAIAAAPASAAAATATRAAELSTSSSSSAHLRARSANALGEKSVLRRVNNWAPRAW